MGYGVSEICFCGLYISDLFIYKNMLNFVHIRKPDTNKQIIINIFKKDKYYDQNLAQNIAPINLTIYWKFHKRLVNIF